MNAMKPFPKIVWMLVLLQLFKIKKTETPVSPQLSSTKKVVGALALIAALEVTAYSFMLSAPFKTMDDEFSIVNNFNIKSFQNTAQILGSSFFNGNAYYRPLVSLSYMLEYHFFDLNPLFYNLDNLLLHLATSISVFFIVFIKYNEIIKKEPNNAQAYYSLGVVYSKIKRTDDAIQFYQRAWGFSRN